MQVLLTVFNFCMPTLTRISWNLVSRDWLMNMWKKGTKDFIWSCRIRAFCFGEDTVLRLEWIGSFYVEVCYVLIQRITVSSLKLGPLVLSCPSTQRLGKQHKVLKMVSENRLCFCALFKIHLLIFPTLYLLSLIKWQIYPRRWEIIPPIKLSLRLFLGVEDTQPVCVESLKSISCSLVKVLWLN